MGKRHFRIALVIVVATLVLLSAAVVYGALEVLHYPTRHHAGAGREVVVEIAHGEKFPDVVAQLAAAHLIDRPAWFRLYAMHRGLANRVRAGKYTLRDDMTPRDLIDTLVKGVEEVQVSVTIPEGKNLREVFALIDQAGVAKAPELEQLARDPEWLKQQGIAGDTAEGYLFPDTYKFRKPSTPKAVLETMVKHHRIVYEDLRAKHARTLARVQKDLGWGDREIVVMASIVEKETGTPEERPRVASVFYNRLTSSAFKSHRLETDPTIRYGCTIPLVRTKACSTWDPAGRLHRAQLDDEGNAYNTYQHAGLPPGPISNPGRASLEAAMAPEDTAYLYFVAKDEKSHSFSRTFEEHQRNVEKYMKGTAAPPP